MTTSLSVIIGGVEIPISSGNVAGASHGHTGHASLTTSIAALTAQNIDLIEIAQDAPTILPVDVYLVKDGATAHLFGGEYIKANFAYRADTVTIHARDWSGLLVDQKRVLTNILGGNTGALAPGEQPGSGISTTNQTISQLVTAIANQFGLTPDLRLSNSPGSNPQVGTIFGNSNDTVLTAVPQSLWGILLRLARDTGNEVYTTPEKRLVFGEPGAGLTPLALGWKMNPVPDGTLPLLDLNIEHNPRRNLTFRVLVLSYDPTVGQPTKGQAYVIGSDMTTSSGATVHAGAWNGAAAAQIQGAVGKGSASKKNAIPLYTFHIDGLTAAQANLRAQSIATDIAKRELIVRADMDILPGVEPSQAARLDGAINAGFLAHSYYVTSFSHMFKMGKNTAKLDTSLMLLDQQPGGAGESVTPGGVE